MKHNTKSLVTLGDLQYELHYFKISDGYTQSEAISKVCDIFSISYKEGYNSTSDLTKNPLQYDIIIMPNSFGDYDIDSMQVDSSTDSTTIIYNVYELENLVLRRNTIASMLAAQKLSKVSGHKYAVCETVLPVCDNYQTTTHKYNYRGCWLIDYDANNLTAMFSPISVKTWLS